MFGLIFEETLCMMQRLVIDQTRRFLTRELQIAVKVQRAVHTGCVTIVDSPHWIY